MKRRSLLFAALAMAACTTPSVVPPTPIPTHEPGTILVTALLDLSGPRASLGNAQRSALQAWSDQQQTRQSQVEIRWKAIDVAGSEARAIIELRRASEEDMADAVILGSHAPAYSEALLGAVALAKLPVILTLPAPIPPAGDQSWLFTLAPQPERLESLVTADLATRGIEEPAYRLAAADADFIRAPVQLSGVRAMRLGGTPKEFPRLADVARRMTPPPVTYFSYLTDPNDLGDFKDPALSALWPGSRRVLGGATVTATAFDAIDLINRAAERTQITSTALVREGIRDRLEQISFAGRATSYAFTRTNHAGASLDDFGLLRWNGTSVVQAVASDSPRTAREIAGTAVISARKLSKVSD